MSKVLKDNGLSFQCIGKTNIEPCVYCTVFYRKQTSNFKTTQKSIDIFSHDFEVSDHIQSVFINMSACGMFTFFMWSLSIGKQTYSDLLDNYDQTYFNVLPSIKLTISLEIENKEISTQRPVWLKVRLSRPVYVPPYAIWKVQMKVIDGVSYVHMEVLTDSHMSSSVYTWNHHNNSDVYMTVDSGVNFFFGFITGYVIPITDILIQFSFERQLAYDERKLRAADQIFKEDNYIFHNIRYCILIATNYSYFCGQVVYLCNYLKSLNLCGRLSYSSCRGLIQDPAPNLSTDFQLWNHHVSYTS